MVKIQFELHVNINRFKLNGVLRTSTSSKNLEIAIRLIYFFGFNFSFETFRLDRQGVCFSHSFFFLALHSNARLW